MLANVTFLLITLIATLDNGQEGMTMATRPAGPWNTQHKLVMGSYKELVIDGKWPTNQGTFNQEPITWCV